MNKNKSIFLTLLILSFFNPCFANDTTFLRLHSEALNTFDYDEITFESSIKSLDSLQQTKYKSIFIENIKNSLIDLKNGKHVKSLEVCYRYLYNSDLSPLDSIIINQQIGKTYYDLNEYVISKKHLKSAYKCANKNQLNSNDINSWLVNIFYATDQGDSAIYYLKDKNNITNTDSILTYTNIGQFYVDQPDSSKLYLFKALSLLNKKRTIDLDGYKFIYVGLGKVHLEQNNLDSALYYFKKTVEDTAQIINWYPYVTANVGIVDIYKEKDQIDSAKYYIDNFFVCPCLDFETNIWLHQLKADYYLDINNDSEYKFHFKQSNIYKDSLIDQLKTNINEVSTLNTSQFSMIEENLKMKNENLIVSNNKSRAYFLLLISSIIVFLLITFIIYFRQKKKKELYELKNKLNESQLKEITATKNNLQLEVKNKNIDLNNIVSNLTLKKEFITEQKKSLVAIIKLDESEIKQALKKYNNEFSSFENIDNNLDILQSKIEDVNSQLINKLKSNFPKLTENDIQICILHLLKLSTKEIAALRNVTPKTIQTSRYRIKKKMGLSEADNIIDYIESI